ASVLPILVHGDAAFAGQGVVTETLNFSRTPGYRSGGTLHVVINNQIGFTTSPEEAHSMMYCTDMAQAVQAPIFHVNAEDPEACCWAIKLALEFRIKYQRDVVLDLVCYRKHGHNEGDDPSFTQPLIYAEIREKKSIAQIYSDKLISEGLIGEEKVEQFRADYTEKFDIAHKKAATIAMGEMCPVHGRMRATEHLSAVPLERLEKVAQALLQYPGDFTIHPKLKKILEKRVETLHQGNGIDWGFAEALAFGTLTLDGCRVRLSGQDCGRGTFSQRHLLLTDFENGRKYRPLSALGEETSSGSFEVFNSTLSEAGVLGFEFGYSSVSSASLVLWEAQFGDFSNGAQIVIDQFLASSEQKWGQMAGVVLLLPHGYEGQGPEHSSARVERYLQLCAENNMTVCMPSCAAQYFHLVRKQGSSNYKRPLVVFTPKSLLRSVDAAAKIEELTSGSFQPFIETPFNPEKSPINHVIFLSGKVYYDVARTLEEAAISGVKVIRMEQFYPFRSDVLEKLLAGSSPSTFLWVQEEPKNMGGWQHARTYLREFLGAELTYVGRPASASTATGSLRRHNFEQDQIMQEILRIVKN
ncbi:MAG: 2-oxoglutarate dehydrogenase E1 component, partial [Bdellovibrionales bacterium]|nr:2-oxoglutarate dehydrogenase E1 component [Bdellovibrionales bacterium]